MRIQPPVFASKKASMAAFGAAVITFVMTALPILMPTVPDEVWKSLANLLTQLFSLYLIGQSSVDVVESFRGGRVTLDASKIALETGGAQNESDSANPAP